ncbi:DUF881 domain-containing protein [Bacillus sp. DTU_2020_1000418_1_SI_GHA_SEK_038]|uniref:DUF881 domain-containing protein n=1 Tax=Bacillus sp. DTU_2020_1000418_1_SI_GHA_SEK_038 TaxID=3077585 RepID=UPI0028E5DC9F|nr:DUF881 domain-containing protein [Bacillus sp. DTU_2020_1000418_1_SI_GHA_SEK_038]WNS77086.1 DUF881 domain-containing protein [Bacillus sp. DTU_2020_1000418_1_SI_GHA_SEK_038]
MDKFKKNINFTLITIVIGFMVAIQFRTVKEPVVRDTRDTWQLREDVMKENELQIKLIREVRSNEEKIAKYETELKQSKEQILRETLSELKEEAGLTNVQGNGIILNIEPVYEELLIGTPVTTVSPDLLKRLVNELNMYNALHISIDGQRLINTTVIRDINGETKVDGHSLNRLPIEIKVIAEDAKSADKLFKRMQVSKSADEFFIDNLRVKVQKPEGIITIPAYENTIRIRGMEPVNTDKGGNS